MSQDMEVYRGLARQLNEAIKRADKKKPTAEDRAQLDRLLREHPAIWRITGDVMSMAASKMIADMETNYSIRQSLKTGWEQMQRDLARPGDGELARLLVQQCTLAWLKLAFTEFHHTHYLTHGNTTIVQGDFWERRLSAAQRRYLRACETLARVRRLQLPAVQVNIAEQQVNQVNQRG